MREFKNKSDYLSYLDKGIKYSQLKLAIMNELDKKIELNPYQTKKYFYVQLNANLDVLKYVKNNMSEKLFEHINHYKLDLDLTDLFNIICTIEALELQKKYNFYGDDGTEYERKINKLKEDTNKIYDLQLDNKVCEIRLPQLTHSTLYSLVLYFKDKGNMSLDTIKDIYEFFKSSSKKQKDSPKFKRANLPRNDSKITKKLSNLNNLYGGKIVEDMMTGINLETIIYSDLYSDQEFYKALRSFSFYTPSK